MRSINYRPFGRSVWTYYSHDSIAFSFSICVFSLLNWWNTRQLTRIRKKEQTEFVLIHSTNNVAFDDADALIYIHVSRNRQFLFGKFCKWNLWSGKKTIESIVHTIRWLKWHFRFYSNSFQNTHDFFRIFLSSTQNEKKNWCELLCFVIGWNLMVPKSGFTTARIMAYFLEKLLFFSSSFSHVNGWIVGIVWIWLKHGHFVISSSSFRWLAGWLVGSLMCISRTSILFLLLVLFISLLIGGNDVGAMWIGQCDWWCWMMMREKFVLSYINYTTYLLTYLQYTVYNTYNNNNVTSYK